MTVNTRIGGRNGGVIGMSASHPDGSGMPLIVAAARGTIDGIGATTTGGTGRETGAGRVPDPDGPEAWPLIGGGLE
jgi:hypothetical protein